MTGIGQKARRNISKTNHIIPSW